MRVPNVMGDWQEYGDGHAGLRVRVHGLEKTEPPRGRDDAAEGLTYFTFRVTVENRSDTVYGIHLEDGQLDIRTGPDGESAYFDWRNSQFIEGFDLYPLRRVTAVFYAAAAEPSLTRVDIQVQLKTDEEWADRRLWSGDFTLHGGPVGTGNDTDTGGEGLACQVSTFLRGEPEQGPGA
ncbi:hypothetical protein [Streptomyces sp. NPDC002845]